MGALSPVGALVSASPCDFVPAGFSEAVETGVRAAGTGVRLKESGAWALLPSTVVLGALL